MDHATKLLNSVTKVDYEALRLAHQSFPNLVFYGDEIPERKLKGALSTYAKDASSDAIIMLADMTIFGSGKEGIVLTEEYFYYHDLISSPDANRLKSENGYRVKLEGIVGATISPDAPQDVLVHYDNWDMIRVYSSIYSAWLVALFNSIADTFGVMRPEVQGAE